MPVLKWEIEPSMIARRRIVDDDVINRPAVARGLVAGALDAVHAAASSARSGGKPAGSSPAASHAKLSASVESSALVWSAGGSLPWRIGAWYRPGGLDIASILVLECRRALRRAHRFKQQHRSRAAPLIGFGRGSETNVPRFGRPRHRGTRVRLALKVWIATVSAPAGPMCRLWHSSDVKRRPVIRKLQCHQPRRQGRRGCDGDAGAYSATHGGPVSPPGAVSRPTGCLRRPRLGDFCPGPFFGPRFAPGGAWHRTLSHEGRPTVRTAIAGGYPLAVVPGLLDLCRLQHEPAPSRRRPPAT